ncbi:hypothetical protein BH20ACT23_BH20ACT23_10230 [soil metagenome]
MQETKTRTPAEDMPSSRPPWIRAVAIVAALALLGGTLYATWQAVASTDDPEPDPIGLDESEPDFSLTDEQAIARLEELRTAALEATRNQDVSVIPAVFTETSPMRQRLIEEIQKLKENDVQERSQFERLELTVTENTPSQINLLEVTDYFPCFRNASGKDVTVGPQAIRQEVEWSLALDDSRWLIENSVIRDDRELKVDGHC